MGETVSLERDAGGRLLEAFIQTLQKEATLLEMLRDNAREEKVGILTCNIKKLDECFSARRDLISRLGDMEGQRVKIHADLAMALGRPEAGLTLAALIGTADGACAGLLVSVSDSIKALSRQVIEMDRSLASLLESALGLVRNLFSQIHAQQLAHHVVYSSRGRLGGQDRRGRLLSNQF